MPIFILWKGWSFTLGCFLPVSILKADLNVAEIRHVQDYTHQKLIWMEVHIFSVKARCTAGKIWVKYIMTTQKSQSQKKIGILGISSREYMHFDGNSAEVVGSRRERCWGYISIFENTPKKLPHLSPKSCLNFT